MPAKHPPNDSRDAATPRTRSLLDDVAIRRALVRIAHEIVERNDDLSRVYLVAIPNGGVPLGRSLVANLEEIAGARVPLGTLDTTLSRDDVLLPPACGRATWLSSTTIRKSGGK